MTPIALRLLALAALIAAGASQTGCVPAAAKLQSLSELGANEAVIVGKVELVPPLNPGEQRITVISTTELKGHVFVFPSDKFHPIEGDVTMAQASGYISAPFGETFYIRRKVEPFYINGVFFYLTLLSNGAQERVFLPAGMKVTMQPGDRAVYVGTLRYHRNEFMEVTKVEIVNESGKESAAFRNKFGEGAKLVSRLAELSSPGAAKGSKGKPKPGN